jgi:glycosyltransferase involved in cell wall biosynthesis
MPVDVRATKTPDAERDIRILMVARFEEQKDHELLLKALSDVSDRSWRLTLVGDGPKKRMCEELANELGVASRVDFVGYSDKVADYLAEADLFALITHWEGFPRSILEAMRSGLPVVVSDVGGCSESVLDGVNGRVVPHGDRQKLTEALSQLITEHELRREMKVQARRLYEERFTFEIMYKRYVDVYEELCGARPASG